MAGLATAAGCQLVASCDIAVASEKATFATPGLVDYCVTNTFQYFYLRPQELEKVQSILFNICCHFLYHTED